MNNVKQATFTFIFIVSICCSCWYFVSNVPKLNLYKPKLNNNFDSIITQLHVYQYSKQGILTNSLISPQVRHFPKEDIYYFKTPRINISKTDYPDWEIASEKAMATHGGKEIIFRQSVKIHQAKGSHNEETTFTTEEISYFPQTKIALTSKEILFKQAENQVQAIGMKANFDKKHIKLLHQARGIYVPNKG